MNSCLLAIRVYSMHMHTGVSKYYEDILVRFTRDQKHLSKNLVSSKDILEYKLSLPDKMNYMCLVK